MSSHRLPPQRLGRQRRDLLAVSLHDEKPARGFQARKTFHPWLLIRSAVKFGRNLRLHTLNPIYLMNPGHHFTRQPACTVLSLYTSAVAPGENSKTVILSYSAPCNLSRPRRNACSLGQLVHAIIDSARPQKADRLSSQTRLTTFSIPRTMTRRVSSTWSN